MVRRQEGAPNFSVESQVAVVVDTFTVVSRRSQIPTRRHTVPSPTTPPLSSARVPLPYPCPSGYPSRTVGPGSEKRCKLFPFVTHPFSTCLFGDLREVVQWRCLSTRKSIDENFVTVIVSI